MSDGNNMSSSDKSLALDAATSQIEKLFGKGSLIRMDQSCIDKSIDVIPSGSLGLNIALGIGGYPRGRIVEIYGPESSGKTTLAIHAIAEAHKKGGVAAFIDAEHALDIQYAQRLGVNINELLISQPDTGEQALEICDILVRSGSVDIIVIDSVAALVPKAEIDGGMGDHHLGLQARLMSQALRKLTSSINKTNTLVIFINQIRMKIGVVFGNPETTTGGNALKFYSSIRIDVRRGGVIKVADDIIGVETRIKVVKNKCAPPFKQTECDILYNKGISIYSEAIDIGCKLGIVERSGAWYSFNDTKLGQGKENAREYLLNNKEILEDIISAIKERLIKPSRGPIINSFNMVSNSSGD
ncbi:protein RecA-like, partial [Rhinoraja longicauda]